VLGLPSPMPLWIAGANLHAAQILASRPENKGKTIITILCDTAERYLSTELFDA